MKNWIVSSARNSLRSRRPASYACCHPSAVSLTRWSGIVWWISRFSVDHHVSVKPQGWRQLKEDGFEGVGDVLLPSDWACLIRMISLGFPMVKKEERTGCDVNNK